MLDSKLQMNDIVLIRKKIDKGGDYSEVVYIYIALLRFVTLTHMMLFFFFFQDNLVFHKRDKTLINIRQKQIKLQLPNINQISDLVVVKKIENLAEARRVYQKFAESVGIDSELNESITCM